MRELKLNEIKIVTGGSPGAFRIALAVVSMLSDPDGSWMYNGGNHRTSSKL